MEWRMYKGARGPSLAANSTPLFSASFTAVPGVCTGDGVAWIRRGQLESETFGGGGQDFLRLQHHYFPPGCGLCVTHTAGAQC